MVSLGTQPANRKSGFGHSSPTGARAQDLSRQPARPDLWGARVSNDPGLPDPDPFDLGRYDVAHHVAAEKRDVERPAWLDALSALDGPRASF